MFEFEEYKTTKTRLWGWVLVLAFSALIIGWGVFIHWIVPDSPRHWDFGTLDDTPASSKYSTLSPPAEPNVPLQIEPPLLQQEHYQQ